MGFFNRIFGSKPDILPGTLLKTDIHSHFIPGIDDGATSLEDSIALIRKMRDLGYERLITTPHIMSDFYRNTPEIILEGLEKVKSAIAAEGIEIVLEAAAEYYCDSAFEKSIVQGAPLLSFAGKHILFELSYLNPSDIFETVVFKLQMEGYTPILAHPERYPYWYHSFDQYISLKERGILLQVNIASLTGHYGTGPKRIAERLIEAGLVDFLGSDVHKLSHIDLMVKASRERSFRELINSGTLRNAAL